MSAVVIHMHPDEGARVPFSARTVEFSSFRTLDISSGDSSVTLFFGSSIPPEKLQAIVDAFNAATPDPGFPGLPAEAAVDHPLKLEELF